MEHSVLVTYQVGERVECTAAAVFDLLIRPGDIATDLEAVSTASLRRMSAQPQVPSLSHGGCRTSPAWPSLLVSCGNSAARIGAR
jgi:hypothetical protein